MAAPIPSPAPVPGPVPPAADPVAIRGCLSPAVAAVFDREWESVLEEAKQSKDFTEVHDLLGKWRHVAYAELKEPGWYFGLLAKAERIGRTGTNPDAIPVEDMHVLIAERLGRQVYRIVPDPVTYDQVAALPQQALRPYAEILATLALTPWNGPSQHRDNPDGAVRRWSFGPGAAGQVIYLILEEQREVHLLLVQWLG